MFSLLREELEKTLKPCPCCGGEARIAEEHYINFTTGYQIVCCKCYVQTLHGNMDVNEAIRTWNTRREPPTPGGAIVPAGNERLVKKVK